VGSTVPRHITPAEADQYIMGYTVAHGEHDDFALLAGLRSHTNGAVFCADVSARDWQLKKNGGQWLLGKTFENYAPIGPAIVTKDSIDPNNVAIMCRVNGETLQDGHTREFVFNPQFCLVSAPPLAHGHLPLRRSELSAGPFAALLAAHGYAICRWAGCVADTAVAACVRPGSRAL